MKTKAFIFIALAGILWGTSGLFVSYLAPLGFTSAQMTCAKGIVSFLFMVGYALVVDRKALLVKPLELLFCILIGLSLFCTGYFYFASMQLTSVSTAVILMYTAPIYVMTFSVLFLGEKMTKLKLFAVILMLAGCCLVSGVLTGFTFDLVGILLGLLAGIGYASYNIFAKLSLRHGGNPISATVYGFLTMAIVAAYFSDPIKMVENIKGASFPSVCLLVGLGIGTAVIPYLVYTTALRDIPAGTASALSIIEPMAASIFSFLFLGEQPDVFSLLGIVLILFAVFSLGVAEETHKINKRDMEKNK